MENSNLKEANMPARATSNFGIEKVPYPAPELSRRGFVVTASVAVASGLALKQSPARAAIVRTDLASLPPYGNGTIPSGIRSRTVNNINGLTVHILEAGFEVPDRPALLLLHGFPELAYSWRKVMLPLASAGYHVIAPDQRGFGRTTGWDDSYDVDLNCFGHLNKVRDALGLISALGYRSVAAVIGHDAGSAVAAWCSLVRPDVFRSVVLMSAPFGGAPSLPFNTANGATPPRAEHTDDEISAQLAALARPVKYYQLWFRTREANENMMHAPQGLRAFFRAYCHYKSADWAGNKPFTLKSRTADELAKMPTYYVMDLDKGMAETVAAEMPTAAQIASCKWLTEDELTCYVTEYSRTGFQGGLQNYRAGSDSKNIAEELMFSGRTIDVPSCYISGKSDWGVYQTPGEVESMRDHACTQMVGFHLVEGAGHWVQQEQHEQVSKLLLDFLQDQPPTRP
jgi:pimeloyl-ACP methyl ester carboxylesterase